MLDRVPASELRHVGRPAKRVDAVEKLTGAALYAGDLSFPGLLHAKVKRSPHAHARILRVDTKRAAALPGVHAVLTGADVDARIGLYLVDKFVLARGVVRHAGEAVAAVAADTPEIARRAIDLIEVDYEPLPAALDPISALEPGAPLVHPDLGTYDYVQAVFTPVPGTNIANHTKLRKGDVEAGFRAAKTIVEGAYLNPSVQHVPMETHVAIGQWGVGDRVTIHSSCQSPFTVRNLFCHAFKLPRANVRVFAPTIGGGFGGKAGIALEPLVCLLSKRAGGRPVRLIATREEEFSLLPCRCGLVYHIKTGVGEDGRILAQKMTMYWDSGAYAYYAVNVTRASGYSGAGPYEIPNAWLDAYTVYTNKPYGTAYRGFGHVEALFAVERHMDRVALAIGMDRLRFRRLNALKPGSVTLTGEVITKHSGNVVACMDAVAREVGYGSKSKAERAYEARTGRRIGKSVVALHKAPAMPPFTATAVILKMNEDGTVLANLSLSEIGQGTYTSVAQIIAEVLRFPLERIRVALETDTDRDPYDWQTVASKGLMLSGNAAILAARDLLDKAYAVAGQILRADPCDLDHDADRIFIRHHPAKGVRFAEIAVGYAMPDGNGVGGPLVGVGRYVAQGLTNLDKETGQGNPALDWTYGAHGMVVGADPETGEYEVLEVATCLDAGRIINPEVVRGQIVGGVVQGLGTAMCEGYVYDEKGGLLNPNFTDNKIPTSLDVPRIVPMAVETRQIDGPFGARGCGEHPMIALGGALGNALKDALGVDLDRCPVRAEDVWRALNRKGKGAPASAIRTAKRPKTRCKAVPEPK